MISSPYYDTTFGEFFLQLIRRLGLFFTGQLPLSALATDEVQLIVLIGIACSCALVGSFLILKRMTMLANSLSHTILVGIVFTYVLTQTYTQEGANAHNDYHLNIPLLLLSSLVMGILTTFLTSLLTHSLRLQEDASIGITFTSLFALGIILVTLLTRNAHIGTEVVMGNVDTLHLDDCKLVLLILGVNVFFFLLFFKEFKITTFDPSLARILGISVPFFNYLLMSLVSLTIVGAFRAVGVLMVLAFITGPVLAARLLTHRLLTLLGLSMAIGGFCSLIGVALSRHLLTAYGIALSTAGIVVCMIAICYMTLFFFHYLRSRTYRSTAARSV